jgi:hypothetical protein
LGRISNADSAAPLLPLGLVGSFPIAPINRETIRQRVCDAGQDLAGYCSARFSVIWVATSPIQRRNTSRGFTMRARDRSNASGPGAHRCVHPVLSPSVPRPKLPAGARGPMADINVVKQIDASMPFEAGVCQKRIALGGSSRGTFDDGVGSHTVFRSKL